MLWLNASVSKKDSTNFSIVSYHNRHMNLVDSQALYSADELAQYYSIFDGEAQQLRRELLEETTAELTAAMADEFVKEARKEDWHDLLIERIGQCKSRRT